MDIGTTLGLNADEVTQMVDAVQEGGCYQLGARTSVAQQLSLRDICDALSAADPPPEKLELTTRERVVVDRNTYAPDGSGRLDAALIERSVAAGATLMVTNVPAWSDLINSRRGPGAKSVVEVNAFLSGPLCQAYPAHFDRLDAVIIQLVGNKGWQLWPKLTATEAAEANGGAASFGTPSDSVMLAPGDVLLMPTHTPHLVASTFTPSVHLAIALRETDRN